MKKYFSIALLLMLLALAMVGCSSNDAPGAGDTLPDDILDAEDMLPEGGSDEDEDQELSDIERPVVEIDIQDYGVITVELYPDAAPITVANFIGLAEDGFYDGLTFHRIINLFMMQGGDPNGDGTGGSGKNITGEFTSNNISNPLSHTRGAVSMARSLQPDSASSQFFIVHEDSLWLDGEYAVFGYVTSGMEVVDAICEGVIPYGQNGEVAAEDQPVITSVKVL